MLKIGWVVIHFSYYSELSTLTQVVLATKPVVDKTNPLNPGILLGGSSHLVSAS